MASRYEEKRKPALAEWLPWIQEKSSVNVSVLSISDIGILRTLTLDESLQLADQLLHRTSHWKCRPPHGHGDRHHSRTDGDFTAGHSGNQASDFLPDSNERRLPAD